MMQISKDQVEIIGWIGVVLIVFSYMAGVFGVVKATDLWYLIANILGSAGIAYSSWYKKDTQPMTLNLIWIVIALIGMFRLLYV